LRCGGLSARLLLSTAVLRGGLRGRLQTKGPPHFGRSANGQDSLTRTKFALRAAWRS